VPDGWMVIVQANRWRGAPVDPAGVPYEIAPGGRVTLSRHSPLWPLPAEPAQIGGVRPPS
jgi:hypothetical protein